MRHIILSISLLLLLVSCNLLSDTELNSEYPGDQYVAWVEQIFTGGQQCNPEDDFVPPDTEKLLKSQGVAVFDTDIKTLGVCGGCSCPAYAAIHYALIHIDKLEAAKIIGFEFSNGPIRSK